jgi:hypothetical protein
LAVVKIDRQGGRERARGFLVKMERSVIQGQKGAVTQSRLPRRARATDRFVSFYFSSLPQQELGFYAETYLEAARTLLRSLRRRGGFSEIAAAPVLFMYRHAIELYLKSIIVVGNRSGPADDEKLFRSLKGHKLSPLLSRVEAVFSLVGWEWKWPLNPLVETKADVQRLLAYLEDIDPESFAFRYPVDKRGRRSIAADVRFNLESVVAALDVLATALDTADAGLKAEFGL